MCRMLGIISRKPISSSYLRDFRVLAEKGKVHEGARPSIRTEDYCKLMYAKTVIG